MRTRLETNNTKPVRARAFTTLGKQPKAKSQRKRAVARDMEQVDLMAELSKAWQSVPYLSLALIVSAWTIGVFGLSILLDDCGAEGESAADAITKLARRREFMKSHVV